MEVTALCVRLVVNVLILLVTHIQQSYPQTSVSDSAARIIPSRLQLFEYESVSFTCEGVDVSAGWKVRNTKEFVKACSNDTAMSSVTCTLNYAFKSDSGEYWCEDEGGGEETNNVTITVTSGSVILESPVLPVMEGEAVTLSCRQQKTSDLPADFFKDGRFIRNSSTGNMTIHSVSKSDEGLYNCHMAKAGESPGSRLVVRDSDVVLESPAHPVKEGDTVTLRCTSKKTSSNLKADFYRDGILLGSSSTREIIIYRVSKSDEGLYRCRISGAGQSPDRWLSVNGAASTFLTVTIYKVDNNVVLNCVSKGWYPEPEVFWLDGEGNLLSAGPPETVRGPDDLYTVSSRVTVEKRHSNSFTCRVTQKETNQTRETEIQVPDHIFMTQYSSGTVTSLAATLALALLFNFCFLLLSALA